MDEILSSNTSAGVNFIISSDAKDEIGRAIVDLVNRVIDSALNQEVVIDGLKNHLSDRITKELTEAAMQAYVVFTMLAGIAIGLFFLVLLYTIVTGCLLARVRNLTMEVNELSKKYESIQVKPDPAKQEE